MRRRSAVACMRGSCCPGTSAPSPPCTLPRWATRKPLALILKEGSLSCGGREEGVCVCARVHACVCACECWFQRERESTCEWQPGNGPDT
jgi:hypothetical protein